MKSIMLQYNYIFQYIWFLFLPFFLFKDYKKREFEHKKVIENLKIGIYPEQKAVTATILNIIITAFIVILFFCFLFYVMFYVRIHIHPLFYISPLGIAITLILLLRRDIIVYKTQEGKKK